MRMLVLGVVSLMCYGAVLAQPEIETPDDLRKGSIDLLAGSKDGPKFAVKAPSLSEDEVGDLDSFGANKIYLGVSQTRPIIVQGDCSGVEPEGITCIEHDPAPALTYVDEPELGYISLPEKATNSLLCFTFTQFATYAWANYTGSQQTGRMDLRFNVQVYNDALLGLTNGDGVPYNGALFVDAMGMPSSIPIVVSQRQTTLPMDAYEVQRDRITRSCTGGIVNKRNLRAAGLTEDQVEGFFKTPMKIVFGVEGSVAMTDFVQFFGGIRIYGDK